MMVRTSEFSKVVKVSEKVIYYVNTYVYTI